MILYHGSNMEVRTPKLLSNRKALDFGNGFYLTSDYGQAERWAKLKVRREGAGVPTVSVFCADDRLWEGLKVLSFSAPDRDWLAYISDNRRDSGRTDEWDVVIGPVANDQTIATIGLYFRGYINADMAVQMLLPQKLKDQYCFKTEASLRVLSLTEVKTV